jgi:DNA primase
MTAGSTFAGQARNGTPVDLGDFLEQEVLPRLNPEQVFTHEAHHWQKDGDKWRGGCPWHRSQSGTSFYIDVPTLRWRCPACDIGGGPIQYLHKLHGGAGTSPRGLAFVNIVRDLAGMAGVLFPEPELSPEQQETARKRETRRALLEAAIAWCEGLLWSERGEQARAYLATRGFTDDDARELRLGLYISHSELREQLRALRFTVEEIDESRVAFKGMSGYVVWPWHDDLGRPLTLYGKYPAKEPPAAKPKTTALPNPGDRTSLWEYTKRAVLYLDRALRAGHQDVVLVEGVTDAALAQVRGDTRVVACVAAELSKLQAENLAHRRIRSVTIALDPDQAGDNGIASCTRSLLANGITPFVAQRLPDGMDPDEFIMAHGIDRWREHVGAAVHGLRYLARRLLHKHRPPGGWTDQARMLATDEAGKTAAGLAASSANDLATYFWPEIEQETGVKRSQTGTGQAHGPPSMNGPGGDADQGSVGGPGRRPEILIDVDEQRVNDEAIAALTHEPAIYQRANMLVHVLRDEGGARNIIRPPGSPRIAPLPNARLREMMADAADWVVEKADRKGNVIRALAHPPDWSVAGVAARGSWAGIRYLEAVVEAPTLRRDGTIIDTPGWDAATGLLYEPRTCFPAVPARPTREQAAAAAGHLLDLVADFPFAGELHKAAWLGGLLTPFARFAFAGPAPLFLLNANTPGSGKTLLATIISEIAEGREMARTAYPGPRDEEMAKVITAVALAGDKLMLLDNIDTESPFGSASLDAALTGTTWKGRILGQSAMTPDLPLFTTWFASGNNVNLRGDIPRRVIPCRLESPEEQPERRREFRYPNLVDHVRRNRGTLVVDALTILGAYFAAGRPDAGLLPLGSFEEWSGVVRAAVQWVTGWDMAATREGLADHDEDRLVHAAVLEGWSQLPGGTDDGVTVAQALRLLKDQPDSYGILRDTFMGWSANDKLPSSGTIGCKLRSMRGRVVNGRMMVGNSDRNGVCCWVVCKPRDA